MNVPAPAVPAPTCRHDFAVVGAGRMGASIAGHLLLQGASVALFDRSDFDRYGVSLPALASPARGSGGEPARTGAGAAPAG